VLLRVCIVYACGMYAVGGMLMYICMRMDASTISCICIYVGCMYADICKWKVYECRAYETDR